MPHAGAIRELPWGVWAGVPDGIEWSRNKVPLPPHDSSGTGTPPQSTGIASALLRCADNSAFKFIQSDCSWSERWLASREAAQSCF